MPTIELHRNPPLIWAHRGARSLAAENTLLAVKLARQAGADGWETDVVLSRDGVPILLHDLNLLRTTNASCHPLFADNPPPLPWRFTVAEMKQLNAGIFPPRQCGTPVARKMLEQGPIGPENADMAVPTLEEGLQLSATLGLFVNIEIKDVSTAMPKPLADTIVSRVHEVIARTGMADRVIISSFQHRYLVQSRQLSPDIPIGALTPHEFSGDPVALVRSLAAQAWHPGYRQLTATAVAKARRAEIAVTPYTVNSTNEMQRLAAWGVSGIVTDRPQDMSSLFSQPTR
ncbi:MAG: glycerophosphodiester phosphodiesterase [Desulfopila sp.]